MGIALEVKDEPASGRTPAQRLVAALKAEEDRGMAVTKSWTDMWRQNLEYFFSEQLAGRRKHKDWDWIVINYIWPSCQQEAAKLSRQQPQFVCDPREPGDAEVAEAWQGWLQWMWERGLNSEGMEIEQLKAILCGKIYGYRVYKLWWEQQVEWDPTARPTPKWIGDVKGRLWKPTLFWATGEESIQDGSVGTVRYVDLEYALARWPDYKAKLREEADRAADESEAGDEDIAGQTASSGTYPAAGIGGSDKGVEGDSNKLLERVMEGIWPGHRRHGGPDEGRTRYVRLSETWFKDYSEDERKIVEPIPIEELLATRAALQMGPLYIDVATQQPLTTENWPKRPPLTWREPRFPNGRYILRAGDTILNEDEETQRYPYRLWPFVTSPHYVIPFMWQGSDAVQLVKTAQDMINVSVSHLVNHMKQYGDPRVAIERGAIDAPKARDKKHFKIFSGAGSIIRLVRGGLNRIKILDPPASSPVIGLLYQLMAQEYKNMVGLQDIAQGKKSAGDLTATESSFLAMSAGDRIHLQTIIEKNWIQRVGLLASEIGQRNYEPERLVRILGENAMPGIIQITQRMKDVKYDLNVLVGSALPFDAEKRIARYLQANQLLQGPPSPMLPELLRVLEVPNWKKILDRHAVWTQWMQFLQLIEAVRGGKIPPDAALQRIVSSATQMLMGAAQQAQATRPAGPQGPNKGAEGAPGGQQNAGNIA